MLNFFREKKLNYIEVSGKINDNVVKMLKEVADQLYNDIKKNKGKKIFTSSSEFTNIRVKNEKNRRRVDGNHKLVYGIYYKSRNRTTFEKGNL